MTTEREYPHKLRMLNKDNCTNASVVCIQFLCTCCKCCCCCFGWAFLSLYVCFSVFLRLFLLRFCVCFFFFFINWAAYLDSTNVPINGFRVVLYNKEVKKKQRTQKRTQTKMHMKKKTNFQYSLFLYWVETPCARVWVCVSVCVCVKYEV